MFRPELHDTHTLAAIAACIYRRCAEHLGAAEKENPTL